ncbi:MAG: type II secretion system F family protein [Magnetococcales bacterium]|nr:type II secretion system F family protein [Magnetococcales bacterium]
METFMWEAVTRSGEKRSGNMEGANTGEVMAQLRKQGLKKIKVKKKPKSGGGFFGGNNITEMEIVIFTRQLSTMVGAGLPLVQCFNLVSKGSENPAVGEVTMRVKNDLEAGTSLTEALNKESVMFDELFVNLVSAGEQSGILEAVLSRLAVYKEKAAALKAKVKSAMTYPIAVLVIAFIITGVLMIFVVPAFADLFSNFGAELPMPTRVVISISEWSQANWWLVLIVIGGTIFTFKRLYNNNENFHYQMDRLSLNLPVFGMILRKSAVARFARTFSTMVAAGTPILESLENVAKTSGNRVVEEAIMNSRSSIAEGRSLTEPLLESGLFPSMVTQMINIGESTGNLEEMLAKIADFYEEEVDRAVDNLTALLEPIILVILGVLIGGLVVAMYMPIFQMGSVVG